MAKKKCMCIFCNSKCPECGSTEVDVNMSISANYENNVESTIVISQSIDYLHLFCNECGKEFDGTELDELRNALRDGTYKDMKEITVSEKREANEECPKGYHEIECTDYNREIRFID